MEYIAIDKSTYDDMLNGIKKTIKEIQSIAEVHNIQSDWVENGELAEMLGISKRQLQGYRERGLIGYSYIGRKIYYRRQDIDKLILLHTINNK